MRSACVVVTFVFLLIAVGARAQSAMVGAEMRRWKSDVGTEILAVAVGQTETTVSLRKEDGIVVEVPKARLSSGDRAFLSEFFKRHPDRRDPVARGVGAADDTVGGLVTVEKGGSLHRLPFRSGANDIARLKADRIDQAMAAVVVEIGCTSGAVAIGRGGTLLFSRSYGWLDREKTRPAGPEAIIGIASCEKPVTAAAIRRIMQARKLSVEEPLVRLLEGRMRLGRIDPRAARITVKHLVEHTAGWGADPVSDLHDTGSPSLASRYWGGEGVGVADVLPLVLAKPPSRRPGVETRYSNFGYDVLRWLVADMSAMTASEYFNAHLLGGRRGFANTSVLSADEATAVWNVADGGPVAASAPALCAFMDGYWLTGMPRDGGDPLWVMHGSLPGSTALMIWRPDGHNIALLFNGRGALSHDAIWQAVEKAFGK